MNFVENIERLELFQMKPEDRHAIFEAWLDKQLDIFWDGSWRTENLDITTLVRSHIYRTKPIPDSIDWSHISENLRSMARDANGKAYLYVDEVPEESSSSNCWKGIGLDEPIPAGVFASYKMGNMPWDQSLVIRPGYQPEAEE